MAVGDIDVHDPSGVEAAGRRFQEKAGEMETRLRELEKRVSAMNWAGRGEQNFVMVKQEFNKVFVNLRLILGKLGGNLTLVGQNTVDMDNQVAAMWQKSGNIG